MQAKVGSAYSPRLAVLFAEVTHDRPEPLECAQDEREKVMSTLDCGYTILPVVMRHAPVDGLGSVATIHSMENRTRCCERKKASFIGI